MNRDGDDWSYANVTKTLKITSCEIIASAQATIFKARTESMHAHLTFKTGIQHIIPPASKVNVDDDESFSGDLLIPWSTVVLKMKKAKKQEKLTGYGYLDHGRSNTLLPKVARSWFRFRGFVPSFWKR